MSTKSIIVLGLHDFLSRGHERTIRAKKNILFSFATKFLSILISFLIVPLTLGYIGKVEYGIWMTISSIVTWFSFFDIGLGNGLRNKLAEAVANNDFDRARIYISSSFALISVVALLLFTVFLIVSSLVSWNSLLNTNIVSDQELFNIVIVVFLFFCLGFVLNVVSSILQALQLYAINDALGLLAQFLGLIGVYFLVNFTQGSLFLLCLVYSSKTVIVMIVASSLLFKHSLKTYAPSVRFIKLRSALPLLNLGIKFFLNQILYLIVTQTSVFLIVQFFGPEEVTRYNIAFRYVSIISMGYLMVLNPFLTAFTEAYTKREYAWIKKTMNKLNKLIVLSFVGTLMLLVGYEKFITFWIGDKVHLPFVLVLTLSMYTFFNLWSGTYGLFLNGVGKLNVQLYLMISQAILFFPLSYVFYIIDMGIISVVIPQVIFGIAGVLILGFQYSKIVNQSSIGIWEK